MSDFADLLTDIAPALFTSQVAALETHHDLLVKWNQRMNLTTVSRTDELVRLHYGEALLLAEQIPAGLHSIADLGSGAGFPGVPIAVRRPDCSVILIESHTRKSVFLRESTRGLGNVRVLDQRGEHVNEHFDWLVSRAVSWNDVGPIAKRLASHLGLLVSGADAAQILQSEGFRWNEPIPVPGGKDRLILTGDVPRET